MPRSYVSPVREQRAERTRAVLVATATAMFVRDGWTATTMARVATEAGVARQTVYQQFDAKLALLDACIDDALTAGEGGAVSDLADYRAMADGPAPERLAAGARWLAGAHERSADIQHVLDEAAVVDPVAAERLREREERRWEQVRHALTLVGGGDPPAEVVDATWLCASRDAWLRLRARGWSADDWCAWFAQGVRAAWPDPFDPA